MATANQQLGEAFVKHYYTTFDSNRAGLVSLYQPNSSLTFEGETSCGPQAILQKLQTGIRCQKCAHQIASCDSVQGGAIAPGQSTVIVFVTGRLSIDDSNPIAFDQVFQLVQAGAGAYVINDIFRLNYG